MLNLIWFLIRWIILAAVLFIGGYLLITNPGSIQIDWLGYKIQVNVLLAAVALVALLIVVAWGYHGWRLLLNAPRSIRENLAKQKREKGYKALTLGMVALAAGDPDEAKRQSKRADNLLNDPPITMLLAAQAAQLNGDEKAARRYFTEMLRTEETKFLGLRGLIQQARATGDQHEALELIREAREMRPDSNWVLDAAFDLETQAGNLIEAETVVRQQKALAFIPKDQSEHRQAVILTDQAMTDLANEEGTAAAKKAARAFRLDPELFAARIVLAKAHLLNGSDRKALTVLEDAWAAEPHGDMVLLYLKAAGAGDDHEARQKALTRLASRNIGAALSHLLLAEVAIDQEDWTGARAELEKAEAIQPSERMYRLMAAVEQAQENDPDRVRELLTKAIDAQKDGGWTCTRCGHEPEGWQAICDSCRGFDSVRWADDLHHAEGLTPQLQLADQSGADA